MWSTLPSVACPGPALRASGATSGCAAVDVTVTVRSTVWGHFPELPLGSGLSVLWSKLSSGHSVVKVTIVVLGITFKVSTVVHRRIGVWIRFSQLSQDKN